MSTGVFDPGCAGEPFCPLRTARHRDTDVHDNAASEILEQGGVSKDSAAEATNSASRRRGGLAAGKFLKLGNGAGLWRAAVGQRCRAPFPGAN